LEFIIRQSCGNLQTRAQERGLQFARFVRDDCCAYSARNDRYAVFKEQAPHPTPALARTIRMRRSLESGPAAKRRRAHSLKAKQRISTDPRARKHGSTVRFDAKRRAAGRILGLEGPDGLRSATYSCTT
jgi:hypothetical protein